MARDPVNFQRARSPEHKRQRQAAILDAARALGLREGVRNVSLADIAAEVGVHKTALLRYFGTREEIYLALAGEAWEEWASTMCAGLAELPVDSVIDVAGTFARTLDARPLLCDLLTHAPLNLERNVSLTAVLTFKVTVLGAVEDIVDGLHETLPDLTERDAWDLVSGVNAIAAGLWQICHPPAAVNTLYQENPRIAHAYPEFVPTVTRLAETLVLGMRARRTAS